MSTVMTLLDDSTHTSTLGTRLLKSFLGTLKKCQSLDAFSVDKHLSILCIEPVLRKFAPLLATVFDNMTNKIWNKHKNKRMMES